MSSGRSHLHRDCGGRQFLRNASILEYSQPYKSLSLVVELENPRCGREECRRRVNGARSAFKDAISVMQLDTV